MRITKYAAYAAALLAPVAAMATPPSPAPSPVDATFAAGIIGVSSDTSSVAAGSTFTNTLFTVIGSGTGDLSGVAGTYLTLSPVTATLGKDVTFTSSIGNFSGTVSYVKADLSTANATLALYALGTFTPASSSFGKGPASLTFAFTQTGGVGSSISGSLSFASPPAPAPVPEPASWAMMIGGFALTGAAVRRRREKTLATA